MLVSIHIPKCAGTTFRHILEGIYGRRMWANYGAIFTREQARPDLVPPDTACIHGHFFADAFADLFPQGRLVTWVRHPVERVLSNYYFFLRHPEIPDGCCQALHRDRLTLRQFADLEWMRNESTRYLAGKSFRDFAFVGVTEQFSRSLTRFQAVFGGCLPAVEPHDNVNPDRRTENYPVSGADYGYILERNLTDLRWYQQAVLALAAEETALAPVFTAGATSDRPPPNWRGAPARQSAPGAFGVPARI